MDFNRPIARVPVPRDVTMADTFYDRLQEQIQGSLGQLREGEQLAAYYYGQGSAPILVTNLGYHNPYLIKIFGKNERDEECLVLAHMNSVQLVLVVEKTDARSPKSTIVFVGQSAPVAADEEG